MKTQKNNTEKKDNPMFAFLPEMIIDHINHPEPTKIKTISNETKNDQTSSTTLTQTISFDPLADPFEGINIEIEPSKKKIKKAKKAKIKFTETITVPKVETTTTTTSENKIIQFVKKIKFNFLNF
jgi:hypothetical protein